MELWDMLKRWTQGSPKSDAPPTTAPAVPASSPEAPESGTTEPSPSGPPNASTTEPSQPAPDRESLAGWTRDDDPRSAD
jgi:hypothetical protein